MKPHKAVQYFTIVFNMVALILTAMHGGLLSRDIFFGAQSPAEVFGEYFKL